MLGCNIVQHKDDSPHQAEILQYRDNPPYQAIAYAHQAEWHHIVSHKMQCNTPKKKTELLMYFTPCPLIPASLNF